MSSSLSKFFSRVKKINFMRIKNINFAISASLAIISILLMLFKGINFGIDFTGGTIIEASLSEKRNISELYNLLEKHHIHNTKIQEFDGNNIMLRLPTRAIANNDIENTKTILSDFFHGKITFKKIDYVGPQVGSELIKNGLMATAFAFLTILLYISVRFEWQFGFSIVLALLHDLIITMGFISLTNIEFDLTTIAAILTIIGYSVNDSVVIFDRIRENLNKYMNKKLADIINISISETLSRTILTVFTTLIAVISIALFGGPAISDFGIITFFGIIIGTYSSIFTSAPMLIHLVNKKSKLMKYI
jgi:preprotein translocase subunit SecF